MSALRHADPLFAEDFDRRPLPIEAAEPEVIEPSFTLAEVDSFREEAWHQGHLRGREDAATERLEALRSVLTTVAQWLETKAAELDQVATAHADAIVRVLFSAIEAVFPSLSTRLGQTEIAAVMRTILPCLHLESGILVRLHPDLVEPMTDEVRRLGHELVQRVEIIPDAAVGRSDVRINWRDGSAVRDTAGLWKSVCEALESAGWPLIDRANSQETLHGE